MVRRGRPLSRPLPASEDARDVNRLVEAVGYAAAAALLGVARHTLENERTSQARQPTPQRAEAARRWLASPAALAALGQIVGRQAGEAPGDDAAEAGSADPGRSQTAFFAAAAAVAALTGAKPWTAGGRPPVLTLVDLAGMVSAGSEPTELGLLRHAGRTALRRGVRLRQIVAPAAYGPRAMAILCEDIIRYLGSGDYDLWVTSEHGTATPAMGPVPSLIASGFAAVLGSAGVAGLSPGLFRDGRLADWVSAGWDGWARTAATEWLQPFDMASQEAILHWEEELYRDEIRPGERLLSKPTGLSTIHLDPDWLGVGPAAATATGAAIQRLRAERRRRLQQQAAAGHAVRELSTRSALEAFARTGTLPRDIAPRTWFTSGEQIRPGRGRQALRSVAAFLQAHPKYRMKWITTPGEWQELAFEVKRPRTGDGVVYFETWRAARDGWRQVNFCCRHQGMVDAFAAKFDELWASEPDTAENTGRGALEGVLASLPAAPGHPGT